MEGEHIIEDKKNPFICETCVSFDKGDSLLHLTEEEICWRNLKEADDHLNLKIFCMAALGWLKSQNGEKTYQDLEKELRKRNFKTMIFASSKRITGLDLVLPFSKTKHNSLEFEAMFSCRPPPFAMEEVLKHSSTYEENLEKLANAGSFFSDGKNLDIYECPDFEKIDDEEQKLSVKVIYNKVLIRISEKQILLSQYFARLEKQYPDVSASPVGIHQSGGPIFAFISKGEMVSNIGFYIFFDGNGDQCVKIIKF